MTFFIVYGPAELLGGWQLMLSGRKATGQEELREGGPTHRCGDEPNGLFERIY